MKKIFSLVLLTGMLTLMSFNLNTNNQKTAGPGDWDWCDGYATGISLVLGYDDWQEAQLFESCMGIEYEAGWQ